MGNPLSAIFKAIISPLLEQAKYIYGLNDNIKALILAIVELEAKSSDVQTGVNIQEIQGLVPLDEVRLWLSRVEEVGSEVCLLLEASDEKLQRLCMYGFCFKDSGFVYPYGKLVSKELKKVELLLSSKPGEVVARRGLPPLIEAGLTRRTIGLEKMLESTWKHLMKDQVTIMGLYGMGGIGKTTLLDQINDMFSKLNDEFYVIYVVVSQDLQIERIQKDIGKRLGLDSLEWDKKAKREKASAIEKFLSRQRFVVLLDDIWRKVDLEDIGIPIQSLGNKSKVVFTTRSKVVCGRMGADAEIEVKCLDSENAWKLFEQKVRLTTLESHPKIPELARIVCEKCKALPLALAVIGETMASKKTVHEWKHTIKVLSSNVDQYPEVEEEILKILKFSYDDLKNERVQECFQYCALFPEDRKIDKNLLVDYWICEGIINGGGNREDDVNEGYGMIGILVNVNLLISFDSEEKVKMHDVVRQMALWIASHFGKREENFVVKSGVGLHQMPNVREWNAVRRMSLQNNEIQNISGTPDCCNLKTLILRKNKLVNISGDFFLSMPKLQVLDLFNNKNIRKLPEEVSNLVNLQYLGLAGTNIESLPAGLRNLINLRHLDLTVVKTNHSISVISSLVNLETLKIGSSTFLTLELIKDIKLLKYLKVLIVHIDDFTVLECLLSTPELARCIHGIFLEGMRAKPISFATIMPTLRSLRILDCSKVDIILEDTLRCNMPKAINFLNLKFVAIRNVRGIQDLSFLMFAPSLRSLYIWGLSRELQEIISREKVYGLMNEETSMRPFENLRTLCLQDLEELKSIYWEPLDFPNLENIVMLNCPKLKKLPLNNESAKKNHIHFYVDNKEWLDSVEWEDQATKDRFFLLSEIMATDKAEFHNMFSLALRFLS